VVFLSNATGISGQDVFDASKALVGTVADSLQTGVDSADISTADGFRLLKDGVQIGIAMVSTGVEVAQAATSGGACTIICGLAEKQAVDVGEADSNKLVACLAGCASQFADDAGEIAANVLDGVASMLTSGVCSSVDIVADVLGATVADLGVKAGAAAQDGVATQLNQDNKTAAVVGDSITATAAVGSALFSEVSCRSVVGSRFGSRCGGGARVCLLIAAGEHLRHSSWVGAASHNQLLLTSNLPHGKMSLTNTGVERGMRCGGVPRDRYA
jgi:hypothetical protein